MMVRHATCERMSERLNGRNDARLTPDGEREAAALARRVAGEGLRVYSSPRLRARQTAKHIAQPHSLPVHIETGLDEVDFGDWSGRTFEALQSDAGWRAWNEDRAHARTPAGESMGDVQHRVLTAMQTLAKLHPGERLLLVTHAEPIRAALLHVHARPLDCFSEYAVAPASICTIHLRGTP
jgi:broad specificity phosphatase PhoE